MRERKASNFDALQRHPVQSRGAAGLHRLPSVHARGPAQPRGGADPHALPPWLERCGLYRPAGLADYTLLALPPGVACPPDAARAPTAPSPVHAHIAARSGLWVAVHRDTRQPCLLRPVARSGERALREEVLLLCRAAHPCLLRPEHIFVGDGGWYLHYPYACARGTLGYCMDSLQQRRADAAAAVVRGPADASDGVCALGRCGAAV